MKIIFFMQNWWKKKKKKKKKKKHIRIVEVGGCGRCRFRCAPGLAQKGEFDGVAGDHGLSQEPIQLRCEGRLGIPKVTSSRIFTDLLCRPLFLGG